MPEVIEAFFSFSSWKDSFLKVAYLSSILLKVSKNISKKSFVLPRFNFKI